MMKKLFYLLLLVFSAHLSNAQDAALVNEIVNSQKYQISSTKIEKNDGWFSKPYSYKNNKIYYPTNSKNPTLKPIILCPGLGGKLIHLDIWGQFLAKRGFLVMIVEPKNIYQLPHYRVHTINDAINDIIKDHNSKNPKLPQNIDISSFAVLGHSMGGGAAQLAAEKNDKIQCIIALTPCISILRKIRFNAKIPKLIISAENDYIATNKINSYRHYDVTTNDANKALFEINKVKHSNPVRSPELIHGVLGNTVFAFLKTYFLNESKYCKLIRYDSPLDVKGELKNNKTKINLKNCTEKNNYVQNYYSVGPNPTYYSLKFKTNKKGFLNYRILRERDGRVVRRGKVHNGQRIYTYFLRRGTYLFKVNDYTFRFIKR